jgi:hypothetical protein
VRPPSGVRQDWLGHRLGSVAPAHQSVRVIWADTGTANVIVAKVLSGWSGLGDPERYVRAESPNEVLLDSEWFPWDKAAVQLNVFATSDAGQSAPGLSVRFDTNRPPGTVIQSAVPQADGRVRLAWTRRAVPTDETPNDPLDLASDPDLLTPTVRPGMPDARPFPVASGVRTFVLPPLARAYPVAVLGGNEWGAQYPVREVLVGDLALRVTIQARAEYGRPLWIRGTAGFRFCEAGSTDTYCTRAPSGRAARQRSRSRCRPGRPRARRGRLLRRAGTCGRSRSS